MLGPGAERRPESEQVDEERLVSAPFARVRLPRSQPPLHLVDQLLGSRSGVADEAESEASLDGQDLGPQPLRGVPPLAVAQEPLEARHGTLQADFLGLSPLSPFLQVDKVSHASKGREGL